MKKIILIAIIMLAFFLCAGAVCSVSEEVIVRGEENTEVIVQQGDEGYGQIFGTVYGSDGWSTFPLPFALVQAGGKSDLTSLIGYFVLNNLPLDVPLQVTADKYGWESQTVQVTLTESNPMQTVNFVLDEDDSGGGFFKFCNDDCWSYDSSTSEGNSNIDDDVV